MLTGDRPETAAAIARDAGIDRVLADIRPGGKALAIRELGAGGNDLNRPRRREFAMTVTELSAIAPAASTGLSRMPVNG